MLNKDIIDVMQPVYGTYKYDWLGFLITRENYLTMHHIVKQNDHGESTIANAALLTKEAHRLINDLEWFYPDLYVRCNELFQRINAGGRPPDLKMIEEINNLKMVVETAMTIRPVTALNEEEKKAQVEVAFNQMLAIFGASEYDWLGCPVTLNNQLHYRHILPISEGGQTTIDNGALLTRKAIELLERARNHDSKLYEEYNYWLRAINDSRRAPSLELIKIMKELKKRLHGINYKHK